jgi:hypothetical protein
LQLIKFPEIVFKEKQFSFRVHEAKLLKVVRLDHIKLFGLSENGIADNDFWLGDVAVFIERPLKSGATLRLGMCALRSRVWLCRLGVNLERVSSNQYLPIQNNL